MIRYFWKYRFLNLLIILISCIFCCLKLTSIKVFFDSERIIELSSLEKDVIEKSVDDSNLLLVGVELDDSLSFPTALNIDSILYHIDTSKYVRSIKSILNERIVVNQSSIPVPIRLFDLKDQDSFRNSLRKIKIYNSNFITSDFKNLIFVVKCQNLDSEDKKIEILRSLKAQFSNLSKAKINITGQIKSEVYMKKNVLQELILFISISAVLCSALLFYFVRNYKLVFVCLLSIFFSIIFSFSVSDFLFGGIELVMIIIPAIIFIITISDFMHLLNTNYVIKNKYNFFHSQLVNVGKPVFLTSLTTAIGFLSFTFGSFEPLMRFGVVTTLSIFICLYIIVTFFALSVDFNFLSKNIHTVISRKIYYFITILNPYRKWVLIIFLIFSILGLLTVKVDNYLTDEINNSSILYQEINYFEKYFGGIKPLSFSLSSAKKEDINSYVDFLESNKVNVDLVFSKNDTTLIKTRIKDIGAIRSNILYDKIQNFAQEKKNNSTIGGVGYLFDQISNTLTYEVLIGLLWAIFLVGLIFVLLNNFNFRYLFVSLAPNLVPLFSCLGLLSLFGFYLSLSNAFIFAIVFGLIVDDSIHIISAYSINRKANKSIKESIKYCKEKTFNAVIKTTVIIIISLVPLLFSEFRSISQLASITIVAAIIALIFDILFLPVLLKRFIR